MGLLVLLFTLLLAALLVEPFCVALKRNKAAAPHPLSGLKIAFVSDLHCRGTPSFFRLKRALSRLAKERPDLLVLGGDYADSADWAAKALALAANLQPPLGVFAVRGNHDYNYDLKQALAGLPIRLLDNEGVLLRRGAGKLYLAGLVDHLRDSPNGEAALRGCEGADFTVLVSHNPRGVTASAGRADLALCGHTHGGQITIFGLYSPLADRRFPFFTPQWRLRHGVPTLYSNGLGTTFLPLRFLAPPQIHLVELFGQGDGGADPAD